MIALIKEIAEGHMEFLAGQVRQEADPAKRLERFFEAGFAWVTANRAQARVLITTLNG
nr:hypothetical protein [Anaerolineae bacterium]